MFPGCGKCISWQVLRDNEIGGSDGKCTNKNSPCYGKIRESGNNLCDAYKTEAELEGERRFHSFEKLGERLTNECRKRRK